MNDFISHIGGDDFVVILNDYRATKLIGDEIIRMFEEHIRDFYEEDDLKNNYIETINRNGELEKIKIMGLSIIALDYKDFTEESLNDVYKKMMKIKKEAKMIDGSVLLY